MRWADRRTSVAGLPADLEATLVSNQPLVRLQLARAELRRRVIFRTMQVLCIFLALVVAGAASFELFTARVAADEVALVFRWGQSHRQLPPGLHLRWPPPVDVVRTASPVRLYTVESGCDRAATEGAAAESSTKQRAPPQLLLTGDGNIVSISYAVHWRIRQINDYFALGDPIKVVCNSSMAAVREVIALNDLGTLFRAGSRGVQQVVQQRLQVLLDGDKTGLLVAQLFVSMNPPPDAIDSFRDVIAAREDNNETIGTAQFEGRSVQIRARSAAAEVVAAAQKYKDDAIAAATAEIEHFKTLYAEYKGDPAAFRQKMTDALNAREAKP